MWDGKETCIDQMDWILAATKNFGLVNDFAIGEELLKRTNVLSYIPIKKTNA